MQNSCYTSPSDNILSSPEGLHVKDYEYGRIKVLAQALSNAGLDPHIVSQIMQDGELIKKSTKPEAKASWMAAAMRRMDALLDSTARHTIRERCACCLGGKRLELSRKIGREHKNLEEGINAANEAKMVFGHRVTHQADGTVLVSFAPEGMDHYRCVCLPKAKEPLSITYCYCCGGHVKHHLQIALGHQLECTVRSSALSSGGKRPCTFIFRIVQASAMPV